MMSRKYYQLVISKFTYRELANLETNLRNRIVASVIKTLRIPLPMVTANSYPDELILVSPSALPAHIVERLSPSVEGFRNSGIRSEIVYTIQTLGPCELYSWAGLASCGSMIANVEIERTDGGPRVEERIQTSVTTELQDGRVLVTSRCKPQFKMPPPIEMSHHNVDSIAELLRLHAERVHRERSKPVVMDSSCVEAFCLRDEQRVYDELLRRGVLQEISKERINQLRTSSVKVRTDAPTNRVSA